MYISFLSLYKLDFSSYITSLQINMFAFYKDIHWIQHLYYIFKK